jgi:hypothetical protein
MATNYFNTVSEGYPTSIVVGDFVQFKRSDLIANYDPTLYTMEFVGRIAGGGNEIKITATNATTHYLFQASSTVTETWTVGDYHWQLDVIRNSDSERYTLERGHNLTVVADLDLNMSDPRTHEEITLEKLRSLIQGKADADVSSYSIAGRSLTKMTFAELTEAEDYFAKKVASQRARLEGEQNRDTGATIKVRF